MTETKLHELDVEHLKSVIEIIEEHDEDDAEDAKRDFERNGLENHWIISVAGKVSGISGYRQIPSHKGVHIFLGPTLAKANRNSLGKKLFYT